MTQHIGKEKGEQRYAARCETQTLDPTQMQGSGARG